jgi:dihydropteroate synthase
MGVINCSPESFYAGSYVPADKVFKTAVSMTEQGAAIIDVGARSTAPRSSQISRTEETKRMDAALRELDGSGITISVDTMQPCVLAVCLNHEIHAVNDISGLADSEFARLVAASGLPAFLMASNERPGDAVGVDATMEAMRRVVRRCAAFGVSDYVLDPGIGLWIPERSVDDDWELCRQFERFCEFDRPLLAAVSRKTFIGSLLNKPPEERLSGSIAVTMMLLAKGASVVRTHDVAATADAVKVYERMVNKA